MGHVARCIPLIEQFIKNNNTVFIAVSGQQQEVLCQYFPLANYITHEGYPFKFGKQGNFSLDLVKQFRELRKRLKNEFVQVENMVLEFQIDIVISDHRYGFVSSKAYSILLTHQVNLPVKWYEGWVQNIHHKFLKAFDEIWVPDTEDSHLSGDLSTNREGFNVRYIGVLSRFNLYQLESKKLIDKVIIVSGPLIYANAFLTDQFASPRNIGLNCKVIVSKEIKIPEYPPNFEIIYSDDWKECDKIILNARKIVARCGYSTLMDLTVLKVPFEITPTPGQREQEYLFKLWNEKALRDPSFFIQNVEHS